MKARLNRLKIENFKGLRDFELTLDGDNVVIKAENGVGKTTVYDAFLWLLFGKNSEGKTDFEVRPLDSTNQPVKGLVLVVEAELNYDNVIHIFRKEHHEKVVKKQLRGYETLCWIDDVPKKVSEYNEYIANLIPEETFKLLTDLSYFSDKLHWQQRRQVLMDIAGNIGKPGGFERLLSKLNGRTVEEYAKVLIDQKKRHEKERDEINPRIDEIQKGLNQYKFDVDIKNIGKERDKLKTAIAELDKKRKGLLDQEQQRQKKIDHINELERKKAEREAELKSDTTAIQDLLDEKMKIDKKVSQIHQEQFATNDGVTAAKRELQNDRDGLNACTAKLNDVRKRYQQAKENQLLDTCYACGQKLPKDKRAELEEKRKAELAEMTKTGNQLKKDVDIAKKAIEKGEKRLDDLLSKGEVANRNYNEAIAYKEKRFAQIDEQIKTNPTKSPNDDERWRRIYDQIIKARSDVGKSVSSQLQEIEDERTDKADTLEQLNRALAHADQIEQSKERIKELAQKEKELAQQIADIEKDLADIANYQATESRKIEQAVNGKFRHVEFKLFDQLLNGELRECCEATYGGVPYSDMSTGQRILCGIDIVNVLSDYYGVSVPLFIDHSESLTIPIEAQTQIIKLFAVENVKKLTVEREGEMANV